MTRTLVELSHAIEPGMLTHPGLPGPEITAHLAYEASRARYGEGTEFRISRISMLGNTGTYVDAPSHRFAGRADLAAMPLERLADLPGLVVRVATRAAGPEVLAPHDVRGKAVLLHTGGDVHWRTERYGVDAPFLTADGADWLVAHGAALVGIDSVNIDDLADTRRPASADGRKRGSS